MIVIYGLHLLMKIIARIDLLLLGWNLLESRLNIQTSKVLEHVIVAAYGVTSVSEVLACINTKDFNAINNAAVVSAIFTVASYTYGPLLGLYAFGLLLKKRTVRDKLVPIVCLVAPAACYALNANSKLLLNGYIFDTELILINGLLTFAGLLLISKRSKETISF